MNHSFSKMGWKMVAGTISPSMKNLGVSVLAAGLALAPSAAEGLKVISPDLYPAEWEE